MRSSSSPASAGPTLDRRALLAAAAVLALACLVAFLVPPIAQPAAYHAFADQRTILGVPRGADVLSNLGFLAVALVAFARLADRGRRRFAATTVAGLWWLAASLAATAVGSALYHLDPRDATLVWDRIPITLAFAGVVGIAVAQRIDARAAAIAMPLVAVLGVASVLYWRVSGNLAPYVVLQATAAIALVAIAAATAKRDDPFPWGWVVAWYALAKVFEFADAETLALTHGVVAGHTLKHLAATAACAAALWPLVGPRSRPGPSRRS